VGGSEEPFFRPWSWLADLRLRGALGAWVRSPGSTDAIPFFSPATASVDGWTGAPSSQRLGKRKAEPERAREIELGSSVALTNHVHLEFTYYNKLTKGCP